MLQPWHHIGFHSLIQISTILPRHHFFTYVTPPSSTRPSHNPVEILIHTFISSRLFYWNSLLFGLPSAHLHEYRQHSTARLFTHTCLRDHITPILKQLHWLQVPDHTWCKLLITHKALNYPHPRMTPTSSLPLSDPRWYLEVPTLHLPALPSGTPSLNKSETWTYDRISNHFLKVTCSSWHFLNPHLNNIPLFICLLMYI